jgi:hypothetical protein
MATLPEDFEASVMRRFHPEDAGPGGEAAAPSEPGTAPPESQEAPDEGDEDGDSVGLDSRQQRGMDQLIEKSGTE